MNQLQTGEGLTVNYSEALSKQLQKMAAPYDWDTVEMEELMQWVSTVTASRSLSISEQREMLISGLKDLSWITSEGKIEDALIAAIMLANRGVRYGAIQRRQGKPAKVTVYFASQ